jgi:hypothetical protein
MLFTSRRSCILITILLSLALAAQAQQPQQANLGTLTCTLESET